MNKLLTVFLAITGIMLHGAEVLKVGCTTYPVWLLTREITAGIKNIRPELLIPAGTGCPHDYVLTPADMRKLGAKNLLVVRNGLGLDDFILRPLRKMNPQAPIIDACFGLAALHSGCGCSHDHEHADEHAHRHSLNPHLFASPDTALGMVANIAGGLCKADPANASAYRRNEKIFSDALRGLVVEMKKLKPLVEEKSVVVQHGVFDYLMRALGLRIAAEIQSGDAAPSAAEMKKLVETIRRDKVSVIFTEPQYSERNAKTLAKECGISVCQLDPLAGGPVNPPRGYYIRTMRENLKKIRSCLGK